MSSLTAALQLGRSGLLASQTALEVAGNNLANMSTQGYHRQTVQMVPASPQEIQQGIYVGQGVQVAGISRQIDTALEARINNSLANQASSAQQQQILNQIQSLENELSNQDLSTQLTSFFNAFSNLANSPQDTSLRGLVVQQGVSLSSYLQNLRSGLVDMRNQTDTTITQSTATANGLLTQIAALNQQIVQAGNGGSGASTLLDQRDNLISQLSQYMSVSVNQQSNGSADVYVNSIPIVQGSQSRGVEIRQTTQNGQPQVQLVVSADGTVLNPQSGQIGALIDSRNNDIVGDINTVDQFTNQLIYQVNRVHSQGQGTTGYSSVTGTTQVADATAALNSSAAGIPFTIQNGSFQVTVTQTSTGQSQTYTVPVTLNGTGADMSLNDLVNSFNSTVSNATASVVNGQLQINTAGSDYQIGFGSDTSGALAALGLNTFFTGSNAVDVAVNADVANNPALVAAGQNNQPGDNSNALTLAQVGTQNVAALNNVSLTQFWNNHVTTYATRLGAVQQQAQADAAVTQSLQTQQQSVSGVNADEETINLLAYQRAYQASARFLSVVDQMYQSLLQAV